MKEEFSRTALLLGEDGVNRLLELLGRFELPTSSLPMTRSTD